MERNRKWQDGRTEGFAPRPPFPAAIFSAFPPIFCAWFCFRLPSACFYFANMWQNYFRSKIDFRQLPLFMPHFPFSCFSFVFIFPFIRSLFLGNWRACKWQWGWNQGQDPTYKCIICVKIRISYWGHFIIEFRSN